MSFMNYILFVIRKYVINNLDFRIKFLHLISIILCTFILIFFFLVIPFYSFKYEYQFIFHMYDMCLKQMNISGFIFLIYYIIIKFIIPMIIFLL